MILSRSFSNFLLTVVLSLFTMSLANAGDWNGEAEVGFVKASGNTESETLNLGLRLLNEGELWTQKYGVTVFRSSSDGLDSADSTEASFTLKRALTERSNVFFSLGYLDDDFDGFTAQKSAALGYGYKFYDSKKFSWETGIGVGYRDTEIIMGDPENGMENESGEFIAADLSVSGATLVMRSEMKSKLTENTQFFWDVSTEIGSDNTFLQNDAAIEVAMNERFALKAQLIVRHNTDPGDMVDKTDTVSLFSLVYRVGQ